MNRYTTLVLSTQLDPVLPHVEKGYLVQFLPNSPLTMFLAHTVSTIRYRVLQTLRRVSRKTLAGRVFVGPNAADRNVTFVLSSSSSRSRRLPHAAEPRASGKLLVEHPR